MSTDKEIRNLKIEIKKLEVKKLERDLKELKLKSKRQFPPIVIKILFIVGFFVYCGLRVNGTL